MHAHTHNMHMHAYTHAHTHMHNVHTHSCKHRLAQELDSEMGNLAIAVVNHTGHRVVYAATPLQSSAHADQKRSAPTHDLWTCYLYDSS